MPRSTIMSSISATVASAPAVISGVVMTAATGVSRSVPGATTRSRRSRSVRKPGDSPATTSEETRSSRMRSAAVRTVSWGSQVTSGRPTRSRARPAKGLAGAARRRAAIVWRIRSPARWTSAASKPGIPRSRSASPRGTRWQAVSWPATACQSMGVPTSRESWPKTSPMSRRQRTAA